MNQPHVDRADSTPRHVVVVGDVVLDREITGRTERICPDAPVPVLDVTSVREFPGAAGLTALLVAASGAKVTLVAPIADDDAGATLLSMLAAQMDVIRLEHNGPTRRKTRVRSAGQSLLRIDDGGPGDPIAVPADQVRAALDTADAVLVSDYGAGTTSDPGMRALLSAAAAGTRIVWDPHPRGRPPVAGVTLMTPNLAEAVAAQRVTFPAGPDLGGQPDLLAQQLRTAWAADAICVTAGATGAFLATSDEQTYFLPAPTVPGTDPCGAGDRFAASVAVALAGGSLITEAAAIGVAAASAWVAAGGAASWRPAGSDGESDVSERDPDAPDPVQQLSRVESLEALASRLRIGGGTLVATGGCFDIVHPGHVATLQAARRLGDRLVVLINSDASVARLKGPGRPVVTALDRARVLQAFDCVDAVAIFDEDDPRVALSALRPDVWVKGGDYGSTMLPETDTVTRHGGRVVLLPYLSGRSTTSIIERSRGQDINRNGERIS
jgi:rfaE bifunctional protein nucleotidyltransferase chain/domain/rfaE bifunctional protein kinase chain/domain